MQQILWNNLSGSQIREVIRMWPELPEFLTQGKSQVIAKVAQNAKLPRVDAKVPKVKGRDLKGMPSLPRQKHVGADGEVQFLAHRNIWVGFWGGRRVVKRSTEKACREALANQYGTR